MARAKGATAVLLLSLALGTGVNAAVFGVLDALLLGAPAGVERRRAWSASIPANSAALPTACRLSRLRVGEIQLRRPSRRSLPVDDNAVENVRLGEFSQSARIAAVSEDFFPALQMRAHRGRLLAQQTSRRVQPLRSSAFSCRSNSAAPPKSWERRSRLATGNTRSLASRRRAFKAFAPGTSATRGF